MVGGFVDLLPIHAGAEHAKGMPVIVTTAASLTSSYEKGSAHEPSSTSPDTSEAAATNNRSQELRPPHAATSGMVSHELS